MNKPKALALWGTSAILMLSVGVVVGWQSTAGAAPAPKTSSAPAALPFSANGNGADGGNNGKGGGNGAGTGAPGKALGVTHVLSGAPAPDGPADLILDVTNTNAAAVQVTAVTARVTEVTPKNDGDVCTTADFEVLPYTGTLPKLAARNGKAQLTLKLQIDNKDVPQDGCQGASIKFTYSVTGNQA